MVNKTLVITGANGFIGSNLILEAKKQKWDVKGIVRKKISAEYIRKLGAIPIIIDDLDEFAYLHTFEGCTALVHLIGIIDGSVADFNKVHVEITRLVLKNAEVVGLNRVITVSGLGVDQYGKAEWATNPYFGSKWKAEQLLHQISIPYVNFRPSYIFGPESYWFASLFERIKKERLNVIGDGLTPMQPVFVNDVVKSFLQAAAGFGPDDTTYDLVGPEVTNMLDIIRRITKYYNQIHHTNYKVKITKIPYREAPKRLNISIEKASVSQCDLLGDTAPLVRELGIKLTALNPAIKYTISNFTLV